jgi:hypothetical protein
MRLAGAIVQNEMGYRVIDAVDLPLGGRRVKVRPVDLEDGCPECGAVSSRVHAVGVQRVRDLGTPVESRCGAGAAARSIAGHTQLAAPRS